jgi:hypothetical protein
LEENLYSLRRKVFLQNHPMCEAHIQGICTGPATECHHKKGRVGKDLLDELNWLALKPVLVTFKTRDIHTLSKIAPDVLFVTENEVSASLLVVRIIVHLRQYDATLSQGLTMDKSEIIPPMPFVAVF